MNHGFSSLKDQLGKLLKEYQLEQSYGEFELRKNWNKLLPKQLAAITSPEKLEMGVLYIRVTNDLWKNEILAKQKELLLMLNEAKLLNKINLIKIV